MKTDMFSMDFNLDYINPEEEEGLDKNEEGREQINHTVEKV